MQLDVGQHKEPLQSTISFCKHEKIIQKHVACTF